MTLADSRDAIQILLGFLKVAQFRPSDGGGQVVYVGRFQRLHGTHVVQSVPMSNSSAILKGASLWGECIK